MYIYTRCTAATITDVSLYPLSCNNQSRPVLFRSLLLSPLGVLHLTEAPLEGRLGGVPSKHHPAPVRVDARLHERDVSYICRTPEALSRGASSGPGTGERVTVIHVLTPHTDSAAQHQLLLRESGGRVEGAGIALVELLPVFPVRDTVLEEVGS